ncbi:hypothetical protein P0D88_16780 [Paraburkholderia sp. RL18-103-BIB-C]|uniref:hypothetical protein n=1 Tax=Paraburkholderia sp. RL18-103-BIB-C TaxID=3031637 RepID=UPI0038BAC668
MTEHNETAPASPPDLSLTKGVDADDRALIRMGEELARGAIDHGVLRAGFRAGDDLAGEHPINQATHCEQESNEE